MKRFSLVLGVVGLGLLASGCSGGPEVAPLEQGARSVEGELEALYGAPFAVERQEARVFWMSPLADTRPLGKDVVEAEVVGRDLFQRFGADLGAGPSGATLKVTRAERDDAGTLSVRFRQVLPGTDVEVWEHGAALDLEANGAMRGASATFVDTANVSPTPGTRPADAERAIRGALVDLGPEAKLTFVDGPRLVAVAASDTLKLAWRATFTVDDAGFEAWVDASTGALESLARTLHGAEGTDLSTTAWPFRSYPLARTFGQESARVPISVTHDADGLYSLVQLPTAGRSRIHTVEQIGQAGVGKPATWTWIRSSDPEEFLGQFPAPGKLGETPYFASVAVDVHHNAKVIDEQYRRLTQEGPAREGLMVAMTHANAMIVTRRDAEGRWTTVLDSEASRYQASYDPVANRVQYGDGGTFAPRGGALVYPTGVALDVAAHEWTHAYVSRKTGLSFERVDGAVQEVLSDAVGKLVALRGGDKDETSIGSGLFVDGQALRSFANPAAYKAPSDLHRGFAATPAHASGMDWDCTQEGPRTKVDQGCVHFNAGPGNHAFFLMMKGGDAKGANVRVERPLPREVLEKVWFESAKNAISSTAPARYGKLELLALQQVDHARRFGADAVKTVACAWYGVGLLSSSSVAARGVICPAAGNGTERAGDCAGKPDGYYCSETTPYSATLCRSGSIAGGKQCAGGQLCAVNDATTRAARLGPDGAPVCVQASP